MIWVKVIFAGKLFYRVTPVTQVKSKNIQALKYYRSESIMIVLRDIIIVIVYLVGWSISGPAEATSPVGEVYRA